MKKQKLLKLPVMPRRIYMTERRKIYEAAVHEETVDGESVLVIELYYSRNDEVTYRIFLGQTDYVTCKLLGKEEQWTHKDIGELIGEIWVNGVGRTIKTEVYTFPEDVEKIKRFTGFTGNHVENIQEYQEKLRKEQRIRRDKKVTDVWDEEIGVLPPLPDDFENFCKKEAVKEHYFFYTKEQKSYRGHCQYCGREDTMEKVRQNTWGICRHCGKRVRYVSMDRRDWWGQDRDVWMIQKDVGRLIVRSFWVHTCYRKENGEVKEIKDVSRSGLWILKPDGRWSVYNWERYRTAPRRWVEYIEMPYPCGCFYRGNAAEWKTETGAGYLPLEQFPTELNLNAKKLLKAEAAQIGAAEKLMKLGLWELGSMALAGELKGKTPKEMLKTQNDDLKILVSAGADYDQYRFFMELKKEGKRPGVEEMHQYRDADIPMCMIREMIPYTTWHQIHKRYRYNSWAILKNYYWDYFHMCRELDFDMKAQFVLFPKNIKKAHDDLVLYYNEKKDEMKGRQRNRVYAKVAEQENLLNEKYAVEDEDYFIRAPHEAAELIKEGHAMHHCVGGENYAKKMAAGESFILFIRKKKEPEKSWYTMEVGSDNKVIQVRGFANGDRAHIRQTNIYKLFVKHLEELQKEEQNGRNISSDDI